MSTKIVKAFYKSEVTRTSDINNNKRKTVMCVRGKNCIFGKDCWFAHSEEELVKMETPKLLPQFAKFRTERCKYTKEQCPYGEKCCFAHSEEELLSPLCRNYKDCTYEGCRFRHEIISLKENEKVVDTTQPIQTPQKTNKKSKIDISFEKGKMDYEDMDVFSGEEVKFTKHSSWGDEASEGEDEDKLDSNGEEKDEKKDEEKEEKEGKEKKDEEKEEAEKIKKLVNDTKIYPLFRKRTKKYSDIVKGVKGETIPKELETSFKDTKEIGENECIIKLNDKISSIKLDDKVEEVSLGNSKINKEIEKRDEKAKIIEQFIKNSLGVNMSPVKEEQSSVRIELSELDKKTNLINVNINVLLKSEDLHKLTDIIRILKNI